MFISLCVNIITPCDPLVLLISLFLVLAEYPVKNLLEEAKKLQQYLWARRLPAELSTVTKKALEIEHGLVSAQLQKSGDDQVTGEELEKVGPLSFNGPE